MLLKLSVAGDLFYSSRQTVPHTRSCDTKKTSVAESGTRAHLVLFQRLSMLIQRFNSALITDTFCFADEDPDL